MTMPEAAVKLAPVVSANVLTSDECITAMTREAQGDAPRKKLEAFRVNPRESRELALLAKARGVNKSELLRRLVREAAEAETEGGNRDG